MNMHLLKISGLAVGMLSLQLAQAQAPTPPPPAMDGDTAGAPHSYQEIIIRQKNDKDAKVTVEIKNGELLINGKPASEYEDGNLVITKRKLKIMRDDNRSDMGSPFRDDGSQLFFKDLRPAGNKAFLGVTSIRTENGPAGAKIGEVSPGSAAEKAGLKEGDLITKVDELPVEGPEDLSRAVGKYEPGDKATITFKREGKEQKVTATLGKGKSNGMEMFRYKGPDDFDMRQFKRMMPDGYNFSYGPSSGRLGIRAQDTEDGKGAKVLYVDGESVAAKAGIKEGDIITSFDGQPVKDATSLAGVARESRLKPTVKVNVLRDGKTMELEVKNPRKLKTADL